MGGPGWERKRRKYVFYATKALFEINQFPITTPEREKKRKRTSLPSYVNDSCWTPSHAKVYMSCGHRRPFQLLKAQ